MPLSTGGLAPCTGQMLWLAAYLTGVPPVGLHALIWTHCLAPNADPRDPLVPDPQDSASLSELILNMYRAQLKYYFFLLHNFSEKDFFHQLSQLVFEF